LVPSQENLQFEIAPVDLTFYKKQAAARAVEFVQSGYVVGLGVGTTAIFAVRRLAERLHAGELNDIIGIPCSRAVAAEAAQLGIPLSTLDTHPWVDLTIDGADQVDENMNLIKGAGGALLREKIVAQASRREIIVIDMSKLTPVLGQACRVPVEVIPFGLQAHARFIESLGAQVRLRQNADGTPFETDQYNYIFDCDFGALHQPQALAARLDAHAGIVEHGLFLGLATDVIVAGPDGLRHLTRADAKNSGR
jgi:ribose 5-phosphate isomerase A